MLAGAEASAGAGAAGTCAAAFRIRPEAKVVAIANESFIRLEYSFKIPASRFLDQSSRVYAQTNLCLLRNISVFIRGTLPRHEQELKRRGWRHQQEQGFINAVANVRRSQKNRRKNQSAQSHRVRRLTPVLRDAAEPWRSTPATINAGAVPVYVAREPWARASVSPRRVAPWVPAPRTSGCRHPEPPG